ncbi:YncE family protein [bacterium]|nr:MAG: YncE family protein [bacterium]
MLHLVPAAPPARVPVYSGFDYVTVDSARGRVYAAHTGSNRLVVVDSRTGRVRGQVRVGPLHGVAVDPKSGDVFTGNGSEQTVSKVDPRTLRVVAQTSVPGPVDALIYDPSSSRVYADEDGGSRIFVIDANTLKQVGTIASPGSDPEYLAVDPKAGLLYQNLNDLDAFAIIDTHTLKVRRIVKTPQLRHNHPLQFDARLGQLIVGGKNGVLSVYTPAGKHVGDVRVQPDLDQCSLDDAGDLLACAGAQTLTVYRLEAGKAPRLVAKLTTGKRVHTVAIDGKTKQVWTVWADGRGDWAQGYTIQ